MYDILHHIHYNTAFSPYLAHFPSPILCIFFVYSAALKNDILLTQPAQPEHDPTSCVQSHPPPEHIFFDNNRQLARVLRGKIPFFDRIGLSVDVLHFDCKHSTADSYCQQYCNPRAFPGLRHDDGSWYLNSSAADQTNSWIRYCR